MDNAAVQRRLGEIGIVVKIRTVEWAAFIKEFIDKVYLSSEERRFALNFLNDHGWDLRNDCIVAVHVGSGDPQKRWFPNRFREVISSIVGSGAKVLLLSGPSDDDIVGQVYEGAERDKVFIVRGIPIREVAAIIETATLFLGNDSGLMHLASAVGIPIVSLFGPSDPVTWGPIGARNVIVIGNCTRIDLLLGASNSSHWLSTTSGENPPRPPFKKGGEPFGKVIKVPLF